MSNRPRCPKCNHITRRIVAATVREPKPEMREIAPRRQRKKPCLCECHPKAAS